MMPSKNHQSDAVVPEFSIVAGGPFFRILQRVQQKCAEPVNLRIGITLALLTWLPLLVIAAAEGNLYARAGVQVPFLLDLEVHARLLIALPLLVLAEQIVHEHMRPLVQLFHERNLVPDNQLDRFQAVIASTYRLRDSALPELLLVGVIYSAGLFIWREQVIPDARTWYGMPTPDGLKPSWAGLIYGWICMPLFQFLLLRWFLRLYIWARLLWCLAGIRLNLIPTHPDRLAGLSFLPGMAKSFTTLSIALGTLLAGYMAMRILFLGSRLVDFKAEVAIMIAFVLCAVLGPLLAFTPMLSVARRRGMREFGALASVYVSAFETKWIGNNQRRKAVLGSADIQSLADLNNSYDAVRSTRVFAITFDVVQQLVAATIFPIAPLLLTVMPIEEILKKLASILF